MTTILLTLHILIAVGLVGVVLLQRNEGVVWVLAGHQVVVYDSGQQPICLHVPRRFWQPAFCHFYWSSDSAGAGSKQTSIVDEVVNSSSELPVPSSPQVPTGQ